jgi:hypothetical protein
MKPHELNRLLREWQRRLGVRDWRLTAQIVGLGEIDDLGVNLMCSGARVGRINILDPAVATPGADRLEQDIEDTLIHEILHCHFSPMYADNSFACEQAISAIADALVTLKREKRK